MPKDWNGCLVHDAGRDRIRLRFKENGKWVQRKTPYLWSRPGDEELALKALAKTCRALKERKRFEDAAGAVPLR